MEAFDLGRWPTAWRTRPEHHLTHRGARHPTTGGGQGEHLARAWRGAGNSCKQVNNREEPRKKKPSAPARTYRQLLSAPRAHSSTWLMTVTEAVWGERGGRGEGEGRERGGCDVDHFARKNEAASFLRNESRQVTTTVLVTVTTSTTRSWGRAPRQPKHHEAGAPAQTSYISRELDT